MLQLIRMLNKADIYLPLAPSWLRGLSRKMITCIHNGPIKKERIGKAWRLVRGVSYDCNGKFIRIEAGFITDGASSPRLFRALIPRWHRKYEHGVLLHDYLYRGEDRQARKTARVFGVMDDRKSADRALLELSAGWRRKPMYYWVRFFGRWDWRT